MFFISGDVDHRYLHSFPTRRSSDLLAEEDDAAEHPDHRDDEDAQREHRDRHGGDQLDPRPVGEREGEDRKSTRLNSSHMSISYAVFCLKKKITDSKQIKHCITIKTT